MTKVCRAGSVEIGPGRGLCIIAGPCTLESVGMGIEIGRLVQESCSKHGMPYIFKASFDKANRTSAGASRGPGLERGLDYLAAVRDELGAPLTTDIHHPGQAAVAARVVDMLQIPAFLCRQTDLLTSAGEASAATGCAVNVKKGQFLSPAEMAGPLAKLQQAGCDNTMVTERGTFFGYHRLVNDFLGLGDLLELTPVAGGQPSPVCFDCTHSTQLPGAGAQSGGRPERAPLLARCAVAAGVHAVFLECHPDPPNAASDGATMLRLDEVDDLLASLAGIRDALAASPAAGGAGTAEAAPVEAGRR